MTILQAIGPASWAETWLLFAALTLGCATVCWAVGVLLNHIKPFLAPDDDAWRAAFQLLVAGWFASVLGYALVRSAGMTIYLPLFPLWLWLWWKAPSTGRRLPGRHLLRQWGLLSALAILVAAVYAWLLFDPATHTVRHHLGTIDEHFYRAIAQWMNESGEEHRAATFRAFHLPTPIVPYHFFDVWFYAATFQLPVHPYLLMGGCIKPLFSMLMILGCGAVLPTQFRVVGAPLAFLLVGPALFYSNFLDDTSIYRKLIGFSPNSYLISTWIWIRHAITFACLILAWLAWERQHRLVAAFILLTLGYTTFVLLPSLLGGLVLFGLWLQVNTVPNWAVSKEWGRKILLLAGLIVVTVAVWYLVNSLRFTSPISQKGSFTQRLLSAMSQVMTGGQVHINRAVQIPIAHIILCFPLYFMGFLLVRVNSKRYAFVFSSSLVFLLIGILSYMIAEAGQLADSHQLFVTLFVPLSMFWICLGVGELFRMIPFHFLDLNKIKISLAMLVVLNCCLSAVNLPYFLELFQDCQPVYRNRMYSVSFLNMVSQKLSKADHVAISQSIRTEPYSSDYTSEHMFFYLNRAFTHLPRTNPRGYWLQVNFPPNPARDSLSPRLQRAVELNPLYQAYRADSAAFDKLVQEMVADGRMRYVLAATTSDLPFYLRDYPRDSIVDANTGEVLFVIRNR